MSYILLKTTRLAAICVKFLQNGSVITIGNLNFSGTDIVLNASGTLYVSAFWEVYQEALGLPLSVLAGNNDANNNDYGDIDGQGSAASFSRAFCLDVDRSTGNLYVSDLKRIRKVTPGGYVSTLSAITTSAYLGIAIDNLHNLYVSDSSAIYKMDTLGNSTVFVPASAGLGIATEIRIDNSGNLIVSSIDHCEIGSISPSGVITRIAGTGSSGDRDGSGSTAEFVAPAGLAIDASNNIYVADGGGNKIRKISHK